MIATGDHGSAEAPGAYTSVHAGHPVLTGSLSAKGRNGSEKEGRQAQTYPNRRRRDHGDPVAVARVFLCWQVWAVRFRFRFAPANDCALMKAFESTLDNGRSRPWILPLWEVLNWISNGGREAGADRRFSADPLRSAVSR